MVNVSKTCPFTPHHFNLIRRREERKLWEGDMTTTRRTFMAGSAAAGALSLNFPGELAALTPARARLRALPYRVLTMTQAATLDAFGEVLLPGAQVAGLSHYIDQQLALPASQQVLMVRYLGPSPPFTDFYAQGIAALDNLAKARHGRAYSELSD